MHTLIATAKLNSVDPQAWLADVLCRIADHPASLGYAISQRIHERIEEAFGLGQGSRMTMALPAKIASSGRRLLGE
jgi:hypothetical protein